MDLEKFEKIIKVQFKNINLLRQALVHRSYLNENPKSGLEDNERMEYLGDAVLELIVTEYLYRHYKNPEGDLTAWRSSLVNSKMLSDIASTLSINDYLYLSKGEMKDTGRARAYILANAFEALIGAIYLDRGYDASKKFVEENLIPRLKDVIEGKLYKDPKSFFQEEAQDRRSVTPSYRLIADWGPDHDKHFRIGVYLGSELIAEGEGKSKQEAEQDAAKNALEKMTW